MVESKLVELVVAGSNPVGHPIFQILTRALPSDDSKHQITFFPELKSCHICETFLHPGRLTAGN